MKKQRISRLLCLLPVFFLNVLCMTFVFSMPAMAAKVMQPYKIPAAYSAKVGSYTFWNESEDGYYCLFCGKTKESRVKLTKGSLDVPLSGGMPVYILTDGKTVVYSGINESDTAYVLGTCSVTGEGNKTLLSTSYNANQLIPLQKYKSNIYCKYRQNNGWYGICSVNASTGKKTAVLKNLYQCVGAPGTKYAAGLKETSKTAVLKIYDLTKKKAISTFKVKKTFDDSANLLAGTKKYFYFSIVVTDPESEVSKTIVYRLPVNGKKAPAAVVTMKNSKQVQAADDTYIYYIGENKKGNYSYYRYHMKKKKAAKISESAYYQTIRGEW